MAGFRSDDDDEAFVERTAPQHIAPDQLSSLFDAAALRGAGEPQPVNPPEHRDPVPHTPRLNTSPVDAVEDDDFMPGFGVPTPPPPAADAAYTPQQMQEILARLQSADPELLNTVLGGMAPAPAPAAPAPAEPASAAPALLVDPDRATIGWRGWLARHLRLPLAKSAAERRLDKLHQAADLIVAQRGRIRTPIIIGVTSFKGGCGKTPISIAMGATLQRVLGEEVAVIDTDLHGTLLFRSANVDDVSVGKVGMALLASRLRYYGPDQIGAVRSYLHHSESSGLWVLPGAEPGRAAEVAVSDYQNVLREVLREFSIVIVDMGVISNGELYSGILSSLTALIMVTPSDATAASFLENTNSLLARRGTRSLDVRSITIVNNLHRKPDAEVDELIDRLKLGNRELGNRELGNRPVGFMPYDKHIGANGVISPAQLSTETQTSMTFAAADIFTTFGGGLTQPEPPPAAPRPGAPGHPGQPHPGHHRPPR